MGKQIFIVGLSERGCLQALSTSFSPVVCKSTGGLQQYAGGQKVSGCEGLLLIIFLSVLLYAFLWLNGFKYVVSWK